MAVDLECRMKNFFQGNISGDILPLFLYSGIAVPLIQRGTVERGEQECNSADFRLFAAQGFGIDHRKAVVQEMRVDLGLQHLKAVFLFGEPVYL